MNWQWVLRKATKRTTANWATDKTLSRHRLSAVPVDEWISPVYYMTQMPAREIINQPVSHLPSELRERNFLYDGSVQQSFSTCVDRLNDCVLSYSVVCERVELDHHQPPQSIRCVFDDAGGARDGTDQKWINARGVSNTTIEGMGCSPSSVNQSDKTHTTIEANQPHFKCCTCILQRARGLSLWWVKLKLYQRFTPACHKYTDWWK